MEIKRLGVSGYQVTRSPQGHYLLRIDDFKGLPELRVLQACNIKPAVRAPEIIAFPRVPAVATVTLTSATEARDTPPGRPPEPAGALHAAVPAPSFPGEQPRNKSIATGGPPEMGAGGARASDGGVGHPLEPDGRGRGARPERRGGVVVGRGGRRGGSLQPPPAPPSRPRRRAIAAATLAAVALGTPFPDLTGPAPGHLASGPSGGRAPDGSATVPDATGGERGGRTPRCRPEGPASSHHRAGRQVPHVGPGPVARPDSEYGVGVARPPCGAQVEGADLDVEGGGGLPPLPPPVAPTKAVVGEPPGQGGGGDLRTHAVVVVQVLRGPHGPALF